MLQTLNVWKVIIKKKECTVSLKFNSDIRIIAFNNNNLGCVELYKKTNTF